MGAVKNSFFVFAAMLVANGTLAATSNTTQITKSVPIKPVPIKAIAVPAPTQKVAAVTPAVKTIATAQKPLGPVYADTSSGPGGEVNTDVAYESVLPKDAQIVAGDPNKNEFFIVAAEDAAKIRQLIDHTKPGTEVAVNNLKSKQPIVKVKLDENNSSLVSMDVVSSVKEVAQDAMPPSVRMTDKDEVMSIFSKNQITPVGSKAVAVAIPKTKVEPEESENKPMMKLLAAEDESVPVKQAAPFTKEVINPLETTSMVKPRNPVLIPDRVVAKEVVTPPVEKPIQLPLASKETAPTLEMLLQRVATGGVIYKAPVTKKVASKKVPVKTVAVKATTSNKVAANKVAVKKVAAKKVTPKALASKSIVKTSRIASKSTVGKIIPYEQIAPTSKKTKSWSVKHDIASAAAKKPIIRKKTIKLGEVKSYSDYL